MITRSLFFKLGFLNTQLYVFGKRFCETCLINTTNITQVSLQYCSFLPDNVCDTLKNLYET